MMKRIIFFLFAAGIVSLLYSAPETAKPVKKVLKADINEAITPVTEKYMHRALMEAKEQGIGTVLFTLDTPGGLLDTTREIVKMLLAADDDGIDTIVYVYPQGSRAGSAGVFITLAAKYAAMSPGCNIGAAHPVFTQDGGGDGKEGVDKNLETLLKKVENDTVAFIQSICLKRNRNVEWATLAVKESVSITADEALKKGVIDYIADNEADLLKQIYGPDTQVEIIPLDKSWAETLLGVLANPNLAYIFLSLGMLGIFIEILHPGLIFPGALGAILLILGLFSNSVIPINFAGVALMALTFVLLVLEVSITSYGLLSIGAGISFIVGSAMLFDSPLPFMRVSVWIIIGVGVSFAALIALAFIYVFPTLRNKTVSGHEGMIGETGEAIRDFEKGKGQVRMHGEIWSAFSDDTILKNDVVRVERIDGLKAYVKKSLRDPHG